VLKFVYKNAMTEPVDTEIDVPDPKAAIISRRGTC